MEKYDGVILKPDLDEALEHYGVKGMKWKKRKHPRMESREKRNKKEAADDLSFNKMKNESKYRSGDDSGLYYLNSGFRRTSDLKLGFRVDNKHPGSPKKHFRPSLNTTNIKKAKSNKRKQKSKLWK